MKAEVAEGGRGGTYKSNSSLGFHFKDLRVHAHMMQMTCKQRIDMASALDIFSCLSKNFANLESSADFFWSSGM